MLLARLISVAALVPALMFVALSTFAACGEDDTNGVAGTGGSGAGGSGAGGSGTGKAGSSSQGEGEPSAVAGVTERHNFVRANVSPAGSPALPDLVWSPEIAASAQAYAEQCIFAHSQGKYGENLYAGTALVTGAAVVDSWAGEVADYSYEKNECAPGKACGHYTQVVWRDSARVGCAVTTCTSGSPFGNTNGGEWQNWVCQYDPPGNYVGEKPYLGLAATDLETDEQRMFRLDRIAHAEVHPRDPRAKAAT